MSDLIARLEAASEGSRELDALVWVATLPPDGKGIDGYGLPDSGAHYEHEADEDGSVTMWVVWSIASRSKRARRPAPAYTTSLDAALTLVPEDKAWCVEAEPGGFSAWVDAGGKATLGDARAPALALTIAALKARTRAPAPGERE